MIIVSYCTMRSFSVGLVEKCGNRLMLVSGNELILQEGFEETRVMTHWRKKNKKTTENEREVEGEGRGWEPRERDKQLLCISAVNVLQSQ